MKKLFLFYLLFNLNLIFAQQGYKIGYEYSNDTKFKCQSTLYIHDNESVFEIGKGKIKTPKKKDGHFDKNEFLRFFYANKSISYYRFIFDGFEILYKDDYTKKINWNINQQKRKQIGKYLCTEAKTIINGRSFTVWFTDEIKVNFGPLKLHNLSGLIVEASDDNGFMKLKFNSISKTVDFKQLNLLKQFLYSQNKVMNYNDYEKKIVQMETAGRIRAINLGKKMKWTEGSYDDNYELNLFLEVPVGLDDELKKLH